MSNGVLTHIMVVHWLEEHSGQNQEILFNIVSKHQTPLSRQVRESVLIDIGMRKQEECLNSNREWGSSKNPQLTTITPKGISKNNDKFLSMRQTGGEHVVYLSPRQKAGTR